jgi:hypothetical protein
MLHPGWSLKFPMKMEKKNGLIAQLKAKNIVPAEIQNLPAQAHALHVIRK